MNIKKVGAMSFFALFVAGCASPVPVAENFPVSYQKVARTAHHWDVIANDVVTQTASTLKSTQGLQGRPIFVAPTTRNSAFDAVFNDFLINQMVDRGLQVNVCAPTESRLSQEPEVKVKYQTRVLIHSRAPQYRPGLLTALAAGVFVGRSIADSDISRDARGLVGIAAGGLLDAATGSLALATRTEVVVTTTIEERNHFIMRRSDIYYIPDGDANLFTRRVSQSPLCPTSSKGETAAVWAEEKADADDAVRSELFADEMRRINPNWQSHLNPFEH